MGWLGEREREREMMEGGIQQKNSKERKVREISAEHLTLWDRR